MVSLEQIGLEWFASNVGGWGGHVHHFTGSPDREHTPEWNVFRRRSQGDLPTVGFDDIHDGGGNQDHEERDRPELRRRLVDALGTDMPDEESEGEEADKE